MADTSGAVATISYWGSAGILLGVFATWLQRTTNARWKAMDKKTEDEALEAAAAKLAAQRFARDASAPRTPAPPPPSASSSAQVELAAARIQLSRALLELDERDAALGRVRAESAESLRRQRQTIDQLEGELRRSAATITAQQALLESQRDETDELRRQIEGATHARQPDSGRGTAAARSDIDRDRRAVRLPDVVRRDERQEGPARARAPDRGQGER